MLSLKSLYKVDKDYEDNFTPRYVVPCQRGMKCCSKGSSETHHVHSDVVPDKRKTSMVSSFSQTDYRNIFSPPQRQTETAKRKEEKTVENSSKDETLDPDTDEIDCFKSTISILSPIPPPPPPPPALINGMKMSPVGHYSSVMGEIGLHEFASIQADWSFNLELRKPAVIPKTPMTPIFWKRLLISEQEELRQIISNA